MKFRLYYILSAILFIFSACEKVLIGPSGGNKDPEVNFEALYNGFKNHYGSFEVRGINWEAVYQENRKYVNKTTSEKELAKVFRSMLAPLNDMHCYIIPANAPDLPGRIESSVLFDTLKSQTDYLKEVVEKNYVKSVKKEGQFIEYGWIEGQIAYLHISEMAGSLKDVSHAMDVVLDEFKDAKGMVVDIRNNSGGDDRVSKYIAGCFASQTKLFMKIRKKSGPGKDEFTAWQDWYVQPEGKTRFTKPVFLLTSRWSQSAAENFALAMRENNNVTLAGDFTAGGFSDVVAKELPNGWIYFISIGDYRAADGTSYEGKGVPPDVLLVNTKEDLSAGKDNLLEYAIGKLK